MKFDFITVWQRILKPPTWAKVVNFLVTLISCIGSIVVVFIGFKGGFFDVIAYVLFGVAGISLTYTVYLIIPAFPKMKRAIVGWMESKDFTYLLLRSFGFRTIIFAMGSFLMSLLFSGFNAYMGIANRSIWYGALAGFYIALAFLRGGVLLYHKNKIGKRLDGISDIIKKARLYRNSGIITLILNVALSVAIAQMIFAKAHFTYMGWTIFAYALYAFYKITASIITFIKAHKQADLTVRAIRNINLIDALVSILALQTALLSTFSTSEVGIDLANTLTGVAVSLISIAIGVYMIISSTKTIKNIKEQNNEQSI